VCDLLRARVTAEKDSVVLRSSCVSIFELVQLAFVENPCTPCIRCSM